MDKKILLVNDLPGYGRMALTAMMPILTHLHYDVYTLPTAIVANALDYERKHILETTEFMENTLSFWHDSRISYDAVVTGFVASQKQSDILTKWAMSQDHARPLFFVDPVIGDKGQYYKGIDASFLPYVKALAGVSDYFIPNYTEACFLTGRPCTDTVLSSKELLELLESLRELTPKSILVTSVKTKDSDVVIGYDHQRKTYFQLPYSLIPVHFPGSGDAFMAIFAGQILREHNMETAAILAMESTHNLIAANQDQKDRNNGLPIEKCLDLVEEIRVM